MLGPFPKGHRVSHAKATLSNAWPDDDLNLANQQPHPRAGAVDDEVQPAQMRDHAPLASPARPRRWLRVIPPRVRARARTFSSNGPPK